MIADFVQYLLPAWLMPSPVLLRQPPGIHMMVKSEETDPAETADDLAAENAKKTKEDLSRKIVEPRPSLTSDPEVEDEVTAVRDLRLARAQVRTACGTLDEATNRLRRRSAQIKAVTPPPPPPDDETDLPCLCKVSPHSSSARYP